jgi:hypothetical protein
MTRMGLTGNISATAAAPVRAAAGQFLIEFRAKLHAALAMRATTTGRRPPNSATVTPELCTESDAVPIGAVEAMLMVY